MLYDTTFFLSQDHICLQNLQNMRSQRAIPDKDCKQHHLGDKLFVMEFHHAFHKKKDGYLIQALFGAGTYVQRVLGRYIKLLFLCTSLKYSYKMNTDKCQKNQQLTTVRFRSPASKQTNESCFLFLFLSHCVYVPLLPRALPQFDRSTAHISPC